MHRDADRLEVVGGTDSGEHEELRRPHGPSGEHHLAVGPNGLLRSVVAHGDADNVVGCVEGYAAAFLGTITRIAPEVKLAFTNYFEPVHEGAVYVGQSAGAVVAGATIRTAFWKGWDDPNAAPQDADRVRERGGRPAGLDDSVKVLLADASAGNLDPRVRAVQGSQARLQRVEGDLAHADAEPSTTKTITITTKPTVQRNS